ncbi:MAG: hypothetical protein JRN52_07880 [Nitrososphaerota archaeon]|nr:hypothetical protein [Nitrososphaerota archaeon]
MSAVKLSKKDKETLVKLASAVKLVKQKTSDSEVVGLALDFANSNFDEFLVMLLKDIEDEPLLDILRKPARRGLKTEARKIEHYLYS